MGEESWGPYRGLIKKVLPELEKIAGQKLDIGISGGAGYPASMGIRVNGEDWGGGHLGYFPTSCAVCWAGYMAGITSGAYSEKQRGQSYATLKLMEYIAVFHNYGGMVLVSSRLDKKGEEYLESEGYVGSESFINPNHGKGEASKGEYRVRIWTKIISPQVFEKWGIKMPARKGEK